MATVVDALPIRQHGPKSSWLDPYMDGRVWRLVRGSDFQCDVKSAQAYVSLYGKRRGMVVQTRTEGDDVLYVQAAPK